MQTAFPGAVIIRLTVVFAPDDALLIPERSDVREVGEVEHGASDWGGGASSDGSASAT